jgi:hypothetical protein
MGIIFRSSNPNIIRITGKKNCYGAANALLELVSITAEFSVPSEFHRLVKFCSFKIGYNEVFDSGTLSDRRV